MVHIPTETGVWVNEDFERLARVVQEYDPQFELRWIPPEARTDPEDRKKPYVIWDLYVNEPVCFASELDTPQGLLAKLFSIDNKQGDVLARMEAENAAAEVLKLKERMDEAEEKMEMVAWLIGTKKNYIKLPGGRKVDDQLRPIL